MNKRFKPKKDKLFYIITISVNLFLLLVFGIILGLTRKLSSFVILIFVFIFVNYILLSSLFGYVEIKKDVLFIKYGLILRKTIPLEKIKKVELKNKYYSDSFLSLKNSIEHIDITYNTYDKTCVSVVQNSILLEELNKIILKNDNKK